MDRSDWIEHRRGDRELVGWMRPEGPGGDLRVRITEVSTERIRVKKDDFGAIDVPMLEYVLPWPMPPELRPRP
ncbi:hypothetical protein [Herbiconiux sp.]|uniref:hypothetical protein n=1 Tax=Herbiconiux sp. TaxID=1871186 RepID=UPI0025C449B6|nr:hypothetical protein [Herbiconiux sp.]